MKTVNNLIHNLKNFLIKKNIFNKAMEETKKESIQLNDNFTKEIISEDIDKKYKLYSEKELIEAFNSGWYRGLQWPYNLGNYHKINTDRKEWLEELKIEPATKPKSISKEELIDKLNNKFKVRLGLTIIREWEFKDNQTIIYDKQNKVFYIKYENSPLPYGIDINLLNSLIDK